MSLKLGTLSLTRPTQSPGGYGPPWQDKAGVALAGTGAMLLIAFFAITIAIAGWVSDLHGVDAGNAALFAKVGEYESWLLPVSVASIALAKFGVAVVLFGIVRRLWVRVDTVKESLPALIGHSGGH